MKSFSQQIMLIVVVVVLMASNWAAADQGVHPLNEFESRNQEGVKKNPANLKFELRTHDGRPNYHFYETIPVEMAFSSSRPMGYSIELLEGSNLVGQDYRFEFPPGTGVVLVRPDLGGESFACCLSNRPWLSAKPTVFRKELTSILRFEKPGVYNIFVTTRRVFRGQGSPNGKNEMDLFTKVSDFTLTSTILTLTILPDDPEWDKQRLSDILHQLHDPQIIDAYLKRLTAASHEYSRTGRAMHDDEQTTWSLAMKSLIALDTAEAIRQRVAIMPFTIEDDQRQGSSLPWDSVLGFTIRPDLMVAAMEDRARDPTLEIDFRFANFLIRYLMDRDHPDLHQPSEGDAQRLKKRANWGTYEIEAKQEVVSFLQSILPKKTVSAERITARTIDDLVSDIARSNMNRKSSR